MKKPAVIILLMLGLVLALSLPAAAETSTAPGPGRSTDNLMKTQLDSLVSSGVITQAQEDAVQEAIKPSGEKTESSEKQDFSQILKTRLDALVSAGTITQEQEDAIITALKPPSGGASDQPGPGQSSENPMKTQLDSLVSSGVITQEQADAVQESLKSSTEKPAPGSGQDFSQVLSDKLDSLVSAGTITQEQEDAIITALKSSSNGSSATQREGNGNLSGNSGNANQGDNTGGIVLRIGSDKMSVNGTQKDIDPGYQTVPVIVNGRTFIPITAIIESLGGTVNWSESDQSVTISLNGSTVVVKIGDKKALVNDADKELDSPPFVSNTGRTMLPLGFVTANLGHNVRWDAQAQTITIE